MAKVELEKISDPEKHLFIERGMREGISCASKRHSKANNKYCSDYDKTKPEKWIVYVDMNVFLFYQDFLSQTLTTHRTAGEGRGPSFIPLYHFHPLMNIQTFI